MISIYHCFKIYKIFFKSFFQPLILLIYKKWKFLSNLISEGEEPNSCLFIFWCDNMNKTLFFFLKIGELSQIYYLGTKREAYSKDINKIFILNNWCFKCKNHHTLHFRLAKDHKDEWLMLFLINILVQFYF
jgi:hypothetical protein